MKEISVLVDNEFFNLQDLEVIIQAAKNSGIDPLTIRFFFSPRPNFPGCPYQLRGEAAFVIDVIGEDITN
jgi:hypothetical protein